MYIYTIYIIIIIIIIIIFIIIIIIIIIWFGLVSPRSYIATLIPTFHKQGNRLDKHKLHANN